MIEITETAQNYFRGLIQQQEVDELGLRIRVMDPGTPRASCDLQFCPEGVQRPDDQVSDFDGFRVFVAADSSAWLVDAQIDFEEEAAGGQLTIKAPNIKGNMPGAEAGLDERIAWILETEVNPGLASHGGRVTLEGVTGANEVILSFGGGCHGCGMVDVTLKEGIEKTLQDHFPEITGILDATDHSTGENPYYAHRP